MTLEKIDLSFLCDTEAYKEFLSIHNLLLSTISNSQSSNKDNIDHGDLKTSSALFDIGPDVFRVTIDKSPSPAFYLKGVAVNPEGFLVTNANSTGPTIVLADLRKELTGKYVNKNNSILNYYPEKDQKELDTYNIDRGDNFSNLIEISSGDWYDNRDTTINYLDLDGYSIFKSLVDAKVKSPSNFLNEDIKYTYSENMQSVFNKKFAWLIALSSTFLKPSESDFEKELSFFPLNLSCKSSKSILANKQTSVTDNLSVSDCSSLGVILSKYTTLTIWLSYIMNSDYSKTNNIDSDVFVNSEECTKYAEPVAYSAPTSTFQLTQYAKRYPVEGFYISPNGYVTSKQEIAVADLDNDDAYASYFDLYTKHFNLDVDNTKGAKFTSEVNNLFDKINSSIVNKKQTPDNYLGNYKGKYIDLRLISYSPLLNRDSLEKYANHLNLDDESKEALSSAYDALGSLFNKNSLFCGSYDYNEFSSFNVDKAEFLPLSASSLTDWDYTFVSDLDKSLIRDGIFGVASKANRFLNSDSSEFKNPLLAFLNSSSNEGLVRKLFDVNAINTILNAKRSLELSNSQLDSYFKDLGVQIFNLKDSDEKVSKVSISKIITNLLNNNKYGKNAVYFGGIKDFINPVSLNTTGFNTSKEGDFDESSPFFTLESSKEDSGIATTYLKVISDSADVSNFVDGQLFLGTSLYLKNLGSEYKNIFTEGLFKVSDEGDIKDYVNNFNNALTISYKNYLVAYSRELFFSIVTLYNFFHKHDSIRELIDNKTKELGFEIPVDDFFDCASAINKTVTNLDLSRSDNVSPFIELGRWFSHDFLDSLKGFLSSEGNLGLINSYKSFRKYAQLNRLYNVLLGYTKLNNFSNLLENVYTNYSNLNKEISNIKEPKVLKKFISSLYENSLISENSIKEINNTLESLNTANLSLINLDKSGESKNLDLEDNLGLSAQVFSSLNLEGKKETVLNDIVSNNLVNEFKFLEDDSQGVRVENYSIPLDDTKDTWVDSGVEDFSSPNANLSWGNQSSKIPLLQNIKALTQEKDAIDKIIFTFSNKIDSILKNSAISILSEAVSDKKYIDKIKKQFSAAKDTDWSLSSNQAELDSWDNSYGDEGDFNSEFTSFIPKNRLKYISRFLLKSDLSSTLNINKKLILSIRELAMFAFSPHSLKGNPVEFLEALSNSLMFNQELKKSINPIRTKAFCQAFVNTVSLHKDLSPISSDDNIENAIIQNLYFILLLNLIYRALLFYRGKIYYNIAQTEGGSYIPPIKGKVRTVVNNVYKLYDRFFNSTNGELLITDKDIESDSEIVTELLSLDYNYISDKFNQALRILNSFVGGLIDTLNLKILDK